MPPHVPLPSQGARGVVTGTHLPGLDAVTQDSHCPLQFALQQTHSAPHRSFSQSAFIRQAEP